MHKAVLDNYKKAAIIIKAAAVADYCPKVLAAEKIKKDPMGEKKHLAFEIVKFLWGEKAAESAQNAFEKTFQEKTPTFDIKVSAGGTLAGTIAPFTSLASVTDAKRLIRQNAVDINGLTVTDPSYKVQGGDKIKVGSRTFLKAK